ncbi:hypothetical protein [Pseudonocardia xishanensis]|uniref:hypothetical protein n=1 Tax=Pseudonocardia xishanensis TaxID=630995 RepID=UPI0031E6BA87
MESSTADDVAEELAPALEVSGTEPAVPAGRTPVGRGWWAGMAVAVLLVLTAIALTVVVAVQNGLVAGRDTDRAAVSDVARQAVQNLVTIDGQNSQGNIDALLGLSTGEFRDQLTKVSGAFRAILQQGAVKSAGTIGSAGVETLDGDRATVLVTANTVVSNTEIPHGAQRNYRMVVELQRQDGQWMASSVEVAP